MLPQQYCLRWKYHHSNLQTMFSQLLDRGCFCDVTLACEGQLIRAHRVVLCACSTFFDSVLSNYASERDPIIIMKDVTFAEVKCLIEFMYKGEINVEHASLPSLLKTADDLKIKGLAEVSWRDDDDGPPLPMAAAEFHSPHRSLAESYAQEMLHQQAQQSTMQSHRHRCTSSPEHERHSPTMDSVLGLSTRMPTLTPIPSASATLEGGGAPVEHYMGPKRKRGRPPLDDAYDVFNVRKMAHYPNNLEPPQRAYFGDEPQPPAHSACLASPPTAASAYAPPKHRQRQRQQLPTAMDNAEHYAGEQESPHDWPNSNSNNDNNKQLNGTESDPLATADAPDEDNVDVKHDIELKDDAPAQPSTTQSKKQEKALERRDRHGKLRHARRSSSEREKSAEKPSMRQRSTVATHDEQHELADVPQPVEEIENEHLVANRVDSPAARSAALLHSSFGKYGPTEAGYLINEHGMLMAHEFGPNVASAAASAAVVAAAAAAAVAANATNGSHSGEHGAGAGGEYVDIKIEEYDATELRLTNEELSQWQDVIKMDDYLAKGRRPQFWEEPFTKRVLDAIKNKRLEMKKAARILGVSYGTLYGRYREVYGCLKHPYSGTAFRNSSASSAASQLGVQQRFDLSFRNGGVLPPQLELGKLRQKDLSELWTRPQI
ncbi:sex determination protein fruitless [Scaptodrosophila lebanonensis]|uniref:Sex determination protein fruitless n=1 Tax=Drosophila lebanonensis TaxID=7225 RepID=A0A6J2TWV7_DROLE|nr:sex determination protein fruitless [Scaptodrosophila lebanonensis]